MDISKACVCRYLRLCGQEEESHLDSRLSRVAAEGRVSFIRDVGKSEGTHLTRTVLVSSFFHLPRPS